MKVYSMRDLVEIRLGSAGARSDDLRPDNDLLRNSLRLPTILLCHKARPH